MRAAAEAVTLTSSSVALDLYSSVALGSVVSRAVLCLCTTGDNLAQVLLELCGDGCAWHVFLAWTNLLGYVFWLRSLQATLLFHHPVAFPGSWLFIFDTSVQADNLEFQESPQAGNRALLRGPETAEELSYHENPSCLRGLL